MQISKISKLFPAIGVAIFLSSLMAVRADDTPAQAAARAALEQKLNEMAAQPAISPPIIVTPAEVKIEQPAPIVMAPPTNTAPPSAEKTVIEKVETPPEAATVLKQTLPPSDQWTNNAVPVVTETNSTVMTPAVKPLETPALPISATKAERLQALLEKYKADQITPAEYHTERAKIIGEP
jgi:hypothetical protein